METNYHYKAFGLHFASAIELPEFQPDLQAQKCDVVITLGDLPQSLSKDKADETIERYPNVSLIKIDGIGRFLVENGTSVIICPETTSSIQTLRIFLIGTAITIILQQRNFLTLHGSAIQYHEKSILLLGNSGVGKSTLAAALGKRGLPALSDDVCAIDTQGNAPILYAGHQHLKLWPDALEKLGESQSGKRKVRPEIEKVFYRDHEAVSEALPLGAIFVLNASLKTDALSFQQLAGPEKIAHIRRYVHRQGYIKALNQEKTCFQQCAKVADNCPLWEVYRPLKQDTLGQLVDALIAMLEAETVSPKI